MLDFFYLDFRQAFDCVSHEILLSKLNTYGIRGITLDWFSSYLTNREQYICINNVDSNPRVIQCGVPHGSIFIPLLFLIFINHLSRCSSQFKYIDCADDSTLSICIPGNNVMDSAQLINSELKWLNIWLKSNKISINADKTENMLFSCNRNVNLLIIKIGNKKIKLLLRNF